MIGLELDDTQVSAVSVDEQGQVLARAQADAGGDLGAAAAKVLEDVRSSTPASSPDLLGVAAINPESPIIAPVVSQLALRFGGAFGRDGAVLSGTACVLALATAGVDARLPTGTP